MLSLVEYISKRKKEDNFNEFDISTKNENLKTAVNYIFEYFNNYFNMDKLEEKTILKEEKLDKYREQLIEYDVEVREWLLEIYSDYGKFINKFIGRLLRENIYFFLINEEREFRALSYECYPKILKKYPFLETQSETIYLFIKEYHRVESMFDFSYGKTRSEILEEIIEWIEITKKKYNVNVKAFVRDWIIYFCENEKIWGHTHRIKTNDNEISYNYKMSNNLFNIDSIYRNMPKKPFLRGKKQEIEILMMYYWLHDISGDVEYWSEYIDKVSTLK